MLRRVSGVAYRGAGGQIGAPSRVKNKRARTTAVIDSVHALRRYALVGATIMAVGGALGGCSFSSDALWPSLSGEDPAASAPPERVVIGEPGGSGPPELNRTNFTITPPEPGQPTGTFVGQKVQQLRQDLIRLQESIRAHNSTLQQVRAQTIENARTYHESVGFIESRLQVGTTPGNPTLVDAWNRAQRELEAVNGDISQMNDLANRVSSDAALSTYLLESVRAAYGLSGAVEEDHVQLAVLEDDTNQTVVLIDRLLTELSDDIRRQSAYLAAERSDLGTLAIAIKNGELFGSSLASRAIPSAPLGVTGGAVAPRPAPQGVVGRRALVTIRFDRPNVDYEQPLFNAIKQALERRPDAVFDVVGVSPQSGSAGRAALDSNAARRNAQQVVRSLADMGLPSDRVSLSTTNAPDARTNEVRIFVR